MYQPTTLDESHKYPIVNRIYPGPQTGSVGSRSFSAARSDSQALAELGFIVVEIDGMEGMVAEISNRRTRIRTPDGIGAERFFQRQDGSVMTTDCSVGARKRRRKQTLLALGAAGLSAFGYALLNPSRAPAVQLGGGSTSRRSPPIRRSPPSLRRRSR